MKAEGREKGIYMENREGFKSRLGFLLVSAGCAIGLGNIWKFPYITGLYGGGAFVLLYFVSLILLGIPVLSMELAIGRGSGRAIIGGYKALEKPGTKWHLHGYVCILGNYLLMMFYVPVTGHLVNYFVNYLTGAMSGISTGAEATAFFENLMGDNFSMILYSLLVILIGFGVCMIGLQKGVERITKFMMMGLFALILILVFRSFTLSGVSEGLKFYLVPNVEAFREYGFGTIMNAAMCQAFFTLAIGIGSMEIFGSYMSKKKSILTETVTITILDTLIAIFAGFIIFPACFTYGVDSQGGSALIFEALPTVFGNMKGGRIWGALFFLFMSFAALSTVFTVFENLVASLMESFGWSRKKATLVNLGIMPVAVLPYIFSMNIWSEVSIFGFNPGGLEDFLVNNLFLPAGGLLFTLFCCFKAGWGFDAFKAEMNTGAGTKFPGWIRYYLIFVLPVLIIIVFLQGLSGVARWIFGIISGAAVLLLYIQTIIAMIKGKNK